MPLAHFRADLLPRHFSVRLFAYPEILLRTIGHRFEMFHPREQQPDNLLVLAHNGHVDWPHRLVFDAPHRIAVVNIRFVRSAIDLRHLIGSKLQRPGRQANEQQATSTQNDETGLTHRGRSYHRAMFAFLWQYAEKVACIVLASLPRTVKRETRGSLGAAALLGTRRVSARQGWAGEKSGLFEHPAGGVSSRPSRGSHRRPAVPKFLHRLLVR